VNIRAFVAFLQVRNEVWSATVALGNTNIVEAFIWLLSAWWWLRP
jgi:hypothetical protein